jgi:hypothetical protein
MKKMKKILLVSAILLLSACSVKEHKIVCENVDRVKLELSDPKHVKLHNVHFFVVTEENVYDLFETLRDTGHEPVFYAVTGDGYRALSLNISELRRYILESKLVLEKYREYYESN